MNNLYIDSLQVYCILYMLIICDMPENIVKLQSFWSACLII